MYTIRICRTEISAKYPSVHNKHPIKHSRLGNNPNNENKKGKRSGGLFALLI